MHARRASTLPRLHIQIYTPTTDPDMAHRPARAWMPATHGGRVPAKCACSKESVNIKTREDQYEYTPTPSCIRIAYNGDPNTQPPIEHTCPDSTPLAPHSAKAPKPCAQSVRPEHRSQFTQALCARTRPPWWTLCTLRIDATLSPVPRTRGANSPDSTARDGKLPSEAVHRVIL